MTSISSSNAHLPSINNSQSRNNDSLINDPSILNELGLDKMNQPPLKHHPNTNTNTNSHHQLHRRDSSVTSIVSPSTPGTAPLTQLANPADANDTMLLSNPIHSPLTTIVNKLPSLAESQQAPIKRTLAPYNLRSRSSLPDPELLLAHSWTMFFSDTSGSKNNPRHHHHHHSQRDHSAALKAAEYQSGMSKVFTDVADVESLCASLSAFKMTIAQGIRDGQLAPQSPLRNGSNQLHSRRSSGGKSQLTTVPDSDMGAMEDTLIIPGNGLGLAAMKADHNLHFFRAGVNPVWEDPWNAKGGRLIIQTTLSTLDPTFESLVLLIAGGVLETDAMKLINLNRGNDQEAMKEGGRVVGVVGSRRNKPGDRIEIWLSGPTIGTAPTDEWVQCIHSVLIREINLPEIRSAKYKNHYN